MDKIQLQEKLLQETKYSKWYLSIIENSQSKKRHHFDNCKNKH